MALIDAKSTTIKGITFAITMHGECLLMHFSYKRKTVQSFPRFKFPRGFCLSANEKHFSNQYESMKYQEEAIVPYFKKQLSTEMLNESQKALVNINVCIGQMIPEIPDSYKAYN